MRFVYHFLLIIFCLGGLNTGLDGLFQLNVAAHLFGNGTLELKIFYLTVGLGALLFAWALLRLKLIHEL